MMKKIAVALPALMLSLAVPAQDIQVADLKKGEVALSVPDSLQNFDYHFDYSVFDSPYKGAYEFSPYFVKMTPDKSVYDGRNFWLRAGAGYTLHPVLDFVWTPVRTSTAALTVFNNGRGYVGDYIYGKTDETYSGHEIGDDLRFQADFIGKQTYSRIGGGWRGMFVGTNSATSGYNALDLDFNVKSRTDNPSFFYYDFDLAYKYQNDNVGDLGKASGNLISLSGCVGPVIQKKFRLLVDFKGDLEMMKSSIAVMGDYSHFFVSATPHVVLDAGPFHLDAGLAVDYSHTVKNLFSLSPSVRASVSIVKDAVDFYAGFVGGQKMHTYGSLKEYDRYAFGMVPEATQVRYDAFGGFKGSIGRNFDYDVKAGYMVVDHALIDYMTVQYGDITKLYIGVSAAWRSDNLEVDGDFSLNPKCTLDSGIGFQSPLYKGDIRAVYNWNKRIYAGATINMMSARKCNDPDFKGLPWFINPGLMFEYRLSGNFGVWAEGGNLLGHNIYTTPGYLVKGAYFTLGISCTL